MAIFNEPRLAVEFLVSEAPGYISRDTILIAQGSGVAQGSLDIVIPGTVLGQVTASGKYIPAVATATDGSQIPAALNMLPVDTTNADAKAAAITSNAEVVGAMITFDPSFTLAQITAALAVHTIKVR